MTGAIRISAMGKGAVQMICLLNTRVRVDILGHFRKPKSITIVD